MKLTRADLEATIRERDPTQALLDHLERSPAPRIPRIRPTVIPTRTPWWRRLISLWRKA